MSTLRLPRADLPIAQESGEFTQEWYKALTNTVSGVNSLLGASIYSDTGLVNAMVIASGATNLTKALTRYVVPAHTNTATAITLNDSKLGAKAVKFPDGSLPAIGQIVAGVTLEVVYNGIYWEIQTLQPANQASAGDFSVGGKFTPLGEIEAPTAGTVGQPLLSAGPGAPPVWGSGFSGTITTAKLTTATGSMTFVNGLLTAQTPAT